MRFFDTYTGFWRRWKLLYVIYNIFNYSKLKANKSIYKKYGLKRSVFMPLHSKHFEKLPRMPQIVKESSWSSKGYEIIPGVFSLEEIDNLNQLIEEHLEKGSLGFNYTGRKIHFAYEQIPQIRKMMVHPEIKDRLEHHMGDEIRPFQSINFHYGSEQQAHSDSIHMSTYPEGGLIAAWIALDDIEEDNGPLFYYPGSHKAPYATNKDIGASTSFMLSKNPNKLYEEYVHRQLEQHEWQKEVFYAKKGDVLIWHGNLLHGGMPHLNMNKTRRSLVIHYFRKEVICYHEISQRPAIMNYNL
ncbi:MAG: phytanoyl-CoA dioxygenase family protein [Bacteroidia bacterium]